MKTKIGIIINKVREIAEQSGRSEEYADVVYIIDYCAEYLTANKDILDKHAILSDFNCPKCGNKVKVHTLYSDVKHYIEIADNISLPELFPLMGLFDLMHDGLSFDAITSRSICLLCFEQYQIHNVSKIILSDDIKKVTRTIMGGINNAN